MKEITAENFLRETGELSILIPALPRPTLAELQVKWQIKEIERDISPTGSVIFKLATILRGEERSISSRGYEWRLASSLPRLLGYQQLEWLLAHQDEYPDFVVLLGKVFIDFPALVVIDEHGDRSIPYGRRLGEYRGVRWHWICFDFYQFGRVAVSGE